MIDSNKFNLHYFESSSMRGLYVLMDEWQRNSEKRLLSTSIHKDGELFCCIALSNPTEVIICHGASAGQAKVSQYGSLHVTDKPL